MKTLIFFLLTLTLTSCKNASGGRKDCNIPECGCEESCKCSAECVCQCNA